MFPSVFSTVRKPKPPPSGRRRDGERFTAPIRSARNATGSPLAPVAKALAAGSIAFPNVMFGGVGE